MTESNTEENDKNYSNNEKSNNQKQSILNTYPIFNEYVNEHILYPNSELDKWKRKLQMIRTRMINKFKNVDPPSRRPVNKPLHEVFQDIMDKKSSFSILNNENNFDRHQMSAKPEAPERKLSKNNLYVCNDTDTSHKSSKPLNVEKTNRIISREINNTMCSTTTKNAISKIKIAPTKRTRSLKKKN